MADGEKGHLLGFGHSGREHADHFPCAVLDGDQIDEGPPAHLEHEVIGADLFDCLRERETASPDFISDRAGNVSDAGHDGQVCLSRQWQGKQLLSRASRPFNHELER